ncbi:hypothetical protein DL770_000584 [Monosporascus sp. CRB-9-2]|nr:hypothetical protein DL770_000584 [Monosporascus sp. CRB-9-2]
MGLFQTLLPLLLAVGSNVRQCLGQSGTPTVYTDPDTGITFDTWIVPDRNSAPRGTFGGMTFGVALPSDALEVDADEFIGILVIPPSVSSWPYEDEVLTSFRFATGYVAPQLYTGDAKLTQISSNINQTHYSIIFRCQNCLSWSQSGASGSASTSSGALVLGWSNAFPAPAEPECASEASFSQHNNGEGIFGAQLDSNAVNPSYSEWAELATATVTGSCGDATPTTTSSTTAGPTATGVPVPTGSVYDYIVVGSGAGGIPIADKLSEAGKKVLLIEKGPPSSGRWGGDIKPEWLEGTNLTRFDVPGLCNEIWVNSDGIACTDTDQMAGCVVGGGTAVNAGLWWKPYELDWDYNFPNGWKTKDMKAATDRVFSRIPGTDAPSMDGKRYLQQGFEVLAGGLKSSGWKEVTANNVPNQKHRTFSHSPFMYINGERGGAMATYLVSADKRSNFDLWTNTAVKRVIRSGGHITGVEVEAFKNGGYQGVVKTTAVTGRVILSAGAFGSAKILMRSGIGPVDQLEIVKSSTDGPTMISNSSWIELPVGYNLEDHTNTDVVISHPNVVFYDFYEAYDDPIPADKNMYLDKRSGILAQAAPNIGPLFWEEIRGADGVVRQLQWTARVEGSLDTPNGIAMTMSQYLGRGAKSRGRMTITPALTTVVSTNPYLRDENDVQAVIQGIKSVKNALKDVPDLVWNHPSENQTVEDYVNSMLVSYTNRRSNHWIGTNKLGTDDGRNGGTSVVDVNTKVYGTDNLFVVDASIFPGHVTTNPQSYIMIAAERAFERILALPANKPRRRYEQCGGKAWTGSFTCQEPYTCTYQNEHYSQIPGQDKVSPAAVAEAKYLLENFDRAKEKRFHFERIIAEGSFGVTFKMKMWEKQSLTLESRPVRRFVMKRSLNEKGRENISLEIEFLRGAIHVSQPFHIDDTESGNTWVYLKGPTLFIEWLDNGLLYDFIERVGDWGAPLPNRMLWRLFLCRKYSDFILAKKSGGLMPDYIMIHNFEEREHKEVPMIKLIDFGMTRELRAIDKIPDAAVKTNMLDIGKVMLAFLGCSHRGGASDMKVTYRGEETTIKSFARDIDGLSPTYRAPAAIVARHKEKMENLDPDIRSLVALCCVQNPNERPELEDLLGEVERHVKTKEQSDYVGKKYYENESNAAISRIVREVMLDAKDKQETEPIPPLRPPFLSTPSLGPSLLNPFPGVSRDPLDAYGIPPPPPRLGPGSGGAGGYSPRPPGFGGDFFPG